MKLKRAYSVLKIKAVEGEDDEYEKVIEGIASTPTPDRMGDIVEPKGAKFSLPMPLLWQHNHDKPVGFVEFAEPTDEGIPFRARLADVKEAGALRDRIEEAWQSVKAGLVRGVSIGFSPLEYSFLDNGGIRFSAWEWIELSLVTVPANAEATIQTIKSIDQKLMAASGLKQLRSTVSSAASSVKPNQPKKGVTTMKKKTLAEQIAAFKDTRAEKSARMLEIVEEAEGQTLDAEAAEEYDTLEQEVAQIDEHLKRLRNLQKAQLETARPVGDANGSGVETVERASNARGSVSAIVKAPKPAPGIRLARYAKALGLANKTHRDIMSVAEELYSQRDPDMIGIIKAAVSGTSSANTDALIGNEGGWADFVDFLRPMTILGRFGQGGIPGLRQIPFRVPLISQTGGGTGYWVGEGKAKPLTRMTAGRTELSPLKVANIAVATMEALRDSSPSAEILIRDDMAAALVVRMDTSFIDPTNAGSAGVRPASITNGITGIPCTGNDGAAVREDVRAAMSTFIAANNPLSAGVWLMSSGTALALSLMVNTLGQREFPEITMNGGTFMGLPVITSEHITDYVVLVNASDIWFADEGGIAVDLSTEASLEMLDNPVGDSAAADPVEAQLVSMFQTNSVAFRAERTINWARRRATAVAVITDVTWGLPETP